MLVYRKNLKPVKTGDILTLKFNQCGFIKYIKCEVTFIEDDHIEFVTGYDMNVQELVFDFELAIKHCDILKEYMVNA